VNQFQVGSETVLVPERVDLSMALSAKTPPRMKIDQKGLLLAGAEPFAEVVEQMPPDERDRLVQLLDWARELETEALVSLSTFRGTRCWVLLPRLKDENVGLATIWSDSPGSITLWRSVFERRAPETLKAVEDLVAPKQVGQGNTLVVTEALLEALHSAYIEATGGLRR